MANPKWKKFEELAGEIQKNLSPTARVTTNERLIGNVGVPRQVDIVVKKNVGQFEILVVIDCKDHKVPVDIKHIEEFSGMVQDLGAHKGAMVASKGYTAAAKTRAEQAGIDLFSLVDTGDHDWKAYVAIPVVCDFRGGLSYQITFRCLPGKPMVIPDGDPRQVVLYNEVGKCIGKIDALVKEKWNKGQLPCEQGTHQDLEMIKGSLRTKVGEEFFGLKIAITLHVQRRLFFGHLPLEQISGFKDELKGKIITPGFKTKFLDVVEVQKKWRKIESLSDLAIMPVMVLQALDSYG